MLFIWLTLQDKNCSRVHFQSFFWTSFLLDFFDKFLKHIDFVRTLFSDMGVCFFSVCTLVRWWRNGGRWVRWSSWRSCSSRKRLWRNWTVGDQRWRRYYYYYYYSTIHSSIPHCSQSKHWPWKLISTTHFRFGFFFLQRVKLLLRVRKSSKHMCVSFHQDVKMSTRFTFLLVWHLVIVFHLTLGNILFLPNPFFIFQEIKILY